jgi:hypothetical protein
MSDHEREREREREREKAGQVGELGGWVVRSLRCTIWVESDAHAVREFTRERVLWRKPESDQKREREKAIK